MIVIIRYNTSTTWLQYIFILLIYFLSFTSCLTPSGSGGASRWDQHVRKIENTLSLALEAYGRGELERAKQLAKDSYYDVFESSGMETAIRLSISSRRAFEIENGFTEVNKLIRKRARTEEVRQAVSELMAMIREDAAHLSSEGEGGATGRFLSSFLILVREGFEAILILVAIIAYLVKSGNGNKVRIIYQSAILAVLASIATALVVRYLLNISGAGQEFLEGATMLLAVAVLFSVSFWLLGKVQAQKWQHYIQSKVERSLTTGSTLALWSAAFLAVYREGAETVLFYQALLSDSRTGDFGAIGLGFITGAVLLAFVFIAIRWGSLKIPIKPFFMGTGIFLYYMAFVFAGEGIKELQEAGALGTSLISGLIPVPFLGIYPTWEGFSLQFGLLLAAGIGLTYQFIYKPRFSSTGRSTDM